ncbi:MAG: hypothetical protein A2W98_02260 [Bacteroidetes bacterium GWF2_33_38]
MNHNLPLEPEKYYHIYNHAVGNSNLFETEDNYYFFLEKYKQYISPYVDTFAYCLMPNHFHLAVRIKDLTGFENLDIPTLTKFDEDSFSEFVSKQFSNFFSSYSQAFNKQQSRRGSLFERPFKRKHITTDEYFKILIHYIHYNPVHLEFVNDLRDWKYSSYESYFSSKTTLIKRDEAISWFGDVKNFEEFHKQKINEKILIEI